MAGPAAVAVADYTGAAQFSSLSSQEQANLAEQEQLAKQQAERLARAEQQRKEIAARQQFYTSALADLRLSQSKTSRGLIETEQRLEMERKACEEMEAQYEAAYEEFNEQHARIGPVLKTLEEVEAEKTALVSKKAALESAVRNLEEYNPEWEARERGACETLRIEIAELVATHAALEKNTEAMKRRQESMVEIIDGLKLKIDTEKAQVDALKAEVDALDAEKAKDGQVLVDLLQKVAPMYLRLYAAARDALVPLPNDVVLGGAKASHKSQGFEYDEARFGAYDCADWHVFQEEEFSIATAIPVDDRLETFISPSVRAIEEEKSKELDSMAETQDVAETEVEMDGEAIEMDGETIEAAVVTATDVEEVAASEATKAAETTTTTTKAAETTTTTTSTTTTTEMTSKIENPVYENA